MRWKKLRLRHSLALCVLAGGASFAQPVVAPGQAYESAARVPSDISVLTYNVAALPWPIARDRRQALQRIGGRLADMRRRGIQPGVVVLQEAFTPEAKTIGDLASYPYQVHGPTLRGGPGDPAGSWYLGETEESAVDSGLVILTDFPVVRVERAAFPAGACAGYDCLAAKGVLLVTVEVPGRGEVSIAATHLNSRKASRASYERTHEAYRRQVDFLSEFLATHREAEVPLIVAGDFNRGRRPVRVAALEHGMGRLGAIREGFGLAVDRDTAGLRGSSDAAWIRRRARDMQFLFDGRRLGIEPVSAEIPFGTESDGSTLSDHMGFTVRYRLSPRNSAT
jgi:endonuclease/exonuclease/phosphatase family metal-dependent hydrolase